MAKSTNQKMKLLYLIQIMLEQTDETHGMTMMQIQEALKAHDISAERKSVYDDMELLGRYGIEIIGEKRDKNYFYHVGSRQFELAELKLLVDAVQSSKFITAGKSNELIRKLEGLASKYEAAQLQRQVYVTSRIKTMNESIYYNVDYIHAAISAGKKVRFQYFQWNVDKEMELKRGGAFYEVSPWALVWDDENYYLVAYDSAVGVIKHYRVDKIKKMEMCQEQREGREHFEKFDTAVYTKKMFGMYGGEEKNVKIKFANELIGVVIDRFGQDITVRKNDETHFSVHMDVVVSRQFLSWIAGLGNGAVILEPQGVVDMMKEEIRRLMKQYGIDE